MVVLILFSDSGRTHYKPIITSICFYYIYICDKLTSKNSKKSSIVFESVPVRIGCIWKASRVISNTKHCVGHSTCVQTIMIGFGQRLWYKLVLN